LLALRPQRDFHDATLPLSTRVFAIARRKPRRNV
jgi:hypothetical protein